MYIGEYSHTLDEKGRITIPSKFRAELTSSFILTRGLDGCLTIYSHAQWESIFAKLNKLPNTKKATRQYIHMLTSQASVCEMDCYGRIQIPPFLAASVHLTKDCKIIGVNDHIEIWDRESWTLYYEEASKNFEEVAEELSELL